MVIHTEWSSSTLKTNHREFTQKAGAAAPREAWWYTSWWHWRCSPPCPPCQSDSLTRGTEAVLWGKVHWSLGPECYPSWWFIFITNTQWVKVFCWWQMLFFGQKCDEESAKGGRTDASPHIYAVFFSSYKLSKTVTFTTLLLFGHVTLLWRTFLYLVEWRTRVVNWPSDQHAPDMWSWLIRSHWFGSPIIQPWYYLQRRIRAGAKFHPPPPPKDSHWDGGGELAY